MELDRFSAAIDVRHPAAGFCDVRVDGFELSEFHPLGIDLADAPPNEGGATECYVRGGDLIATYADRPAPEMRAEVYWRAGAQHRKSAIAAIELLASVQTNLLDSCPKLAVRSRLLACEVYQLLDAERATFAGLVPPLGEGLADESAELSQCYLFRLPGRQYSYVEMVHPSDARHSTWDGWLHGTDYRMQLCHELFADRLEKGVILRARVLGVLLDRQGDKAAAAEHWKAFLREALPLTT